MFATPIFEGHLTPRLSTNFLQKQLPSLIEEIPLVARLVETRHLFAHQGLPILYLLMFYLSGHLKSLVDKEKTRNREERLRTEVDAAEQAR
jgi:hypothetical protein